LDLHRQSLRQHGLLHERDSVEQLAPGGGVEIPITKDARIAANEEAVRAESRRRKEEARLREVEEMKKIEKEKNSLWNWIRGK
jgi:hypothetical protein